jgi:hypothetical protein
LLVLGFTLLRRPLEMRAEKKRAKAEKPPTDWKKVALHAGELYAAVKALAGALVKNTTLKRVAGTVKLELPDPAQTGMLVGCLYAGSGIAKAFLPQTDIEIEPSFAEEKLDADVKLELSLPLFKVIIPVIRFFHSTRKIF